MNSNVIEIAKLTKCYGDVVALDGLDMQVRRGEVFGFLGPNGSGKTTTIRCLLDLIRPSSGKIRVFGVDPQRDAVAVRKKVGYLPGELHLDDNMTAVQALKWFDAFRGGAADWKYVGQVVERFHLDGNTKIRNFSKGNKQKVGIAQALMHRPDLLLLDEPTSGLDPLMQRELLQVVSDLKSMGTTVFFSSHALSEVQAIADRVGVVRDGKLVEVAKTSDLLSRQLRKVDLRLREGGDEVFDECEGVEVITANAGFFQLQVTGDINPLFQRLAQLNVEEFDIRHASLEEIFLTYYRSEARRDQQGGAS